MEDFGSQQMESINLTWEQRWVFKMMQGEKARKQ